MKAVILAGGFGSRLSEETVLRPKPMVEIGGKPILWHIMNIYSGHGVKEFIIALGYKAEIIKEHFLCKSSDLVSLKCHRPETPRRTYSSDSGKFTVCVVKFQ